VREGVALIIGRQRDMKVVGLAATGEEAIEMFSRLHPDVTLMDLRLATLSGVDAIRAIRQIDSCAKVIVLTMYQGDEDIFQAMNAGAVTYLLKDTLSDDLIRVIREAHTGRPSLLPQIQARLAERASGPTLTQREVQVIQLISRGLRNKEIAVSLGITEETTQVHVKNILSKLHVKDRTAAVNVAVRRGIIHIT
jgi:two-component system NarL family response regulator